ncbi:MAG: methyltransferase domain-containing protein [Propioniciclava sp.]|uniref:putative RNA methyltransferase n=1 Tax=Propioniciclava sp. TaxID=2038686 RepID=UPI0039E5B8C5
MSLDAAQGLLACPVCAGALNVADRPASCRDGHRFDVARQGYLNLLGGPQPEHADTASMVEARARVLTSGAFHAVDAALARRTDRARTILDVGGGTGHHLARLLDTLPGARGVTLDISTAAARRAARAHPRAASVVADAWGTLPVRPGRFDLVTCVFAPRNMAAFARALTPSGLLVVVTPEPDHLASVRERHGLLGIDPDKDDRLLRSASGHFQPVARHRVRSVVDADAALVADLIAMGPNAFHGVPTEVEPLTTEISVSVWVFRPAQAQMF